MRNVAVNSAAATMMEIEIDYYVWNGVVISAVAIAARVMIFMISISITVASWPPVAVGGRKSIVSVSASTNGSSGIILRLWLQQSSWDAAPAVHTHAAPHAAPYAGATAPGADDEDWDDDDWSDDNTSAGGDDHVCIHFFLD